MGSHWTLSKKFINNKFTLLVFQIKEFDIFFLHLCAEILTKNLSHVVHLTLVFPCFGLVWIIGSDSSRHLLADAFLDSAKTFLVCSIIGFTIGEYVKLGGGVIFAFDSSGSSLARVEL